MGTRKIKLTNRIKEARTLASQLTQQQLADEVGVTRQTIIAIEANKYFQPLEVAFLIARCLGTAVEEVFGIKKDRS